MNRRARLSMLVLLLAPVGCSTLSRERLADGTLPSPPGADDAAEVTAVRNPAAGVSGQAAFGDPSPEGGWFERQRFIFARAWQEMRRDMEYEDLDSFREWAPEASREVRMMRDDLAGADGTVTTARRRRDP